MPATSDSNGRRRLLRLALLALLAALGLQLAPSARATDDQAAQILGNWLTEPLDGIIEISVASDGSYQGKIVGGNAPERLDQHNPDPARQSLTLLGQIIVRGMKYDGGGEWSGGTIYDPDSGRTYKCRLAWLDRDRLQVRGFIGFALLGRSQVWTRYLGNSLILPMTAPQH
jgi:uncharacterized protein (DUF2147 family)